MKFENLKLSRRTLRAALVVVLIQGHTVFAASPFSNLREIQENLGFTSYYLTEYDTNRIKVAVFDTGFHGYEEVLGESLPADLIYHPGPLAPVEGSEKIEHGRVMAQIVYELMTDRGRNTRYAPTEFHLYNVSGFTNFKAAIADVIERKIDVVIYSEVWQLGGNWDGAGFINAEVNKATQAGVLWVNAAGNFGGRTYQSEIKEAQDDWVKLPDPNDAIELKCAPPESVETKKCSLKAVLTWNDFKSEENIGTDKDLDLALSDDFLNILVSSSLKQVKDTNETRPGYSNYPRESIVYEVDPGVYLLRVKNRSKNFTSKDRLRVVVDGDFITIPSGQYEESLLNPADNATVITVGANDSERSSVSKRLNKPDIYAPSRIVFAENERDMRGSSNAAAIVGAGLAMLKSLRPDVSRSELLNWVKSAPIPNPVGGRAMGAGLRAQDLRFGPPQGSNCYPELTPAQMKLAAWPSYYEYVLSEGGRVVSTSAGLKILLPFDPISLQPSMRRLQYNDIIMITPNGYQLAPRTQVYSLPAGAVEIFQASTDFGICNAAQVYLGDNPYVFKLPPLEK